MNTHFDLPDRDPYYITDSNLSKEIKDELKNNRKCYVHGVPGVGKSSLAVELAHELLKTHFAIWFDCANEAKVKNSVENLADTLDISFNTLSNTVRKIKNKLSEENKNFIIILDNVEKYEQIKDIAEGLPHNCFVIITTRDERLNLNIKKFKVHFFDKEKAKTYIKDKVTGRKLTNKNIYEVIDLIKSSDDAVLPLDLKFVTSYLNENLSLLIESYFQKLKSSSYMEEILKQFKEKDEDALELLSCISYMDGDFIELSLMAEILKKQNDMHELQESINKLKRLSLVDELIKEKRMGIKIHRLIQEKTQTCFKTNEVFVDNCLKNILEILSPIMENINNKDHSKWRDCKRAYTHATKFLESTENFQINSMIQFQKNVTKYQRIFNMDLEVSIKIETKIIEKLSNQEEIASSYNNIGSSYWYKGKYDEALKYYFKSLSIQLESVGKDHTDVATTYNYIGICNSIKGNYDEALNYYNKNLAIKLKTFGENHIDVSKSYNNIGICYHEKGIYDEALYYYNKSLAIRSNLLGEDHTDVAMSYNNIGETCRCKGNYDEAFKCYNKSLDIHLKVLGEKHSSVATCYNNIGECFRLKRNYTEALEMYNKGLAIRLKLFDEEHADVASSYNNIGSCYYDKGNCDDALKYHKKSLEIRLKILGEDHTHVAINYSNIGSCYYDKEDYDEALNYHKKSLAIRRNRLGENHTDVSSSYYNIANCYWYKGNFYKALKIYEKSFTVKLKIFEAKYPDSKMIRIGFVLLKVFRFAYMMLKLLKYTLNFFLIFVILFVSFSFFNAIFYFF